METRGRAKDGNRAIARRILCGRSRGDCGNPRDASQSFTAVTCAERYLVVFSFLLVAKKRSAVLNHVSHHPGCDLRDPRYFRNAMTRVGCFYARVNNSVPILYSLIYVHSILLKYILCARALFYVSKIIQ